MRRITNLSGVFYFIMIGVYKITNPLGQVYIGASKNIEKRLNAYKYNYCKTQKRIYNSILQYGYKNHKIEVLEECEINDLKYKERYYQHLHNVFSDEYGLNCIGINIYGFGTVIHKDTKYKLSLNAKNRIFSNETRLKMGIKRKNSKHTEESKNKIRIALLNNNALKGKQYSVSERIILGYKNCIPIIDIETGVFYYGTRDLSLVTGINRGSLCCMLKGKYKNKTNFRLT